MKRIFLIGFLVSSLVFQAMAQRTVSGTITSAEDGEPLPGVSVLIKGTGRGQTTDFDGKFSIQVDGDATLVFSYIGFKTQEIAVGSRSVVNVSLESDVTELNEVVVTAVGITREKKALGYAVSTVGSEKIAEQGEGDIGRLLRGEAPGVNVTQTSGVSGSATNIIIRGYTSITGTNQPLFVVDGVPFNSGTNYGANFADGQTESSRFLDLDPNNIESVSVLKGLAATALYGQQGRNGVILITTKAGSRTKGSNQITVSQSVFANTIASMPDYQTSYGNGFYQLYGQFFSNWGPHFDDQETIPHWYSRSSLADAFPDFQGTTVPYQDYSPTENFFRTGLVSATSINVTGSNDALSYNMSYGYTDDQGFTPGNDLIRNNFSLGANTTLDNGLSFGGSVMYTTTDFTTPPIAASNGSSVGGAGSSVFGDLFYTPRSVDLNGLPYENPLDGSSVYYRGGNDITNPRWIVDNASNSQDVSRYFGQLYADYKVTDWLNATYRFGLDVTAQNDVQYQNIGAADTYLLGRYMTRSIRNTIQNHDLILTADTRINEDFGIRGTLGAQARRDEYESITTTSTGQVIFDVLNHFNFTATNASQFRQAQNQFGVYGQAELDFRKFVYLTLVGRNDWVNTLENVNNQLFYPSASLAVDLTSGIPALQNSSTLDFLKVRVGYGSSAGFPDPYNTRNTLASNARGFVAPGGNVVTTHEISDRLGNPDLRPERISEIELGIEGQFFGNRLGFDLSLYNKTTQDLILDRRIDPATGYTVTLTNAGALRVQGIELAYNATLVEAGDFTWKIQGNFVADETTVTDLPDDTEAIIIAGYTTLHNTAIEGQPFGIMRGFLIDRTAEGQAIIDGNGDYISSDDIGIIGDPNADFNTMLTNTLRWKGLSFNMEWQYRHGGDVYSTTARSLLARGLAGETEFDRSQTFILEGVNVDNDGNVTGANKTQIAATDLYFTNVGFGPDEVSIWDASTIRLQELSLSYDLPKSVMENTPFSGLRLTATGNNLWYLAYNMPRSVNFDTNVLGTGVGNGLGFDFLNGPSSRRIGGSVKLTF